MPESGFENNPPGLPFDWVMDELQKTSTHIEQLEHRANELEGKVFWVGHYSSTSLLKQFFALRGIHRNIIPILPMSEPLEWHRPPEFDATTGKVSEDDALAAMIIKDFPESTAFADRTVQDQAEIQAVFKALFDWNAGGLSNCGVVWATDVRGAAGDGHPLQKGIVNPRKQREALEHIADTGLISGATGVAVGEIPPDERYWVPSMDRLLLRNNFLQASVPMRITIEMTRGQIEEYISNAQKEMLRSGFVLDILGPVCQGMGLVKKIELGVDFKETPLIDAAEVIAGYPTDLLHSLLSKKWAEGKRSQDSITPLLFAQAHTKKFLQTLSPQ